MYDNHSATKSCYAVTSVLEGNVMRIRRGLTILALAAALGPALGGCTTPRIGANITALRASVAATDQQSRLAFEAANAKVRAVAVERKLGQTGDDRLKLAETDFPLLVDSVAAEQWSTAFGILDQYAAGLERLVDPERSAATGDALSALGTALNGPTVQAKLSPGLVGVFAALGQAITQGIAEKSAAGIMERTDPSFHAVTDGMAAAIGDDPAAAGTVIFTVNNNWNTSILAITADYSDARITDPGQRRAMIAAYIKALDGRDAANANLAALHASLLALGEAHSAAGSAKPGEARFWLGRIESLLTDIQRRIDVAKAD